MKNTSELTVQEAKEALKLLQKSEGNLTKEGKAKIEQLKAKIK